MKPCLVKLADLNAALTREVQGEARRPWSEMNHLERLVRVMAEKLNAKRKEEA